MIITVFTSNHPRHTALLEVLSAVAKTVYAVRECSTVFPGTVADFFRKSPVMQDYFARVTAAETEVFGRPRFAPANVHQLPVKMGDVSQLSVDDLTPALDADLFIVFGASFIKGELCERLERKKAVNIHMGVSPYYRGSSTNFWAMYDRRPQYVGATIHLLSAGLDSGPMLFHALPAAKAVDPFVHGMLAVKAAHEGLIAAIRKGTLFNLPPISQDRSQELRYTRNADFTDGVAAEYLARLPQPDELKALVSARDLNAFTRPFVAPC